MWLDLNRVRLQSAVAVWRGIGAAFGHGMMERSWFDAIALLEEDVDELAYATNTARMDAAVKGGKYR